ncbi:MAG: hypothetical protein PUC18_06800 [Prevotellaceae bacterium]|nr:hypothetical protein [Prevotellaceae bacterium]
MKKILTTLAAILISINVFPRPISDVRQILVGEWYEEGEIQPFWVKYNADGTGSLMMSIFLAEESLGNFTWSVPDAHTLVTILPDGKVSRETIEIIDNNTITLDGKKHIRRGSRKKLPSESQSNSSRSDSRQSQSGPSSSTGSKPIVIKHVKTADDFAIMYANLIGLPFDFRTSNLAEIKAYCSHNGYYYKSDNYKSDQINSLKWIQVSNPVTEIFCTLFEVRIYEHGHRNAYDADRMTLEWLTKPYSSTAMMNADFNKFTSEIEKAGGIFIGYDEGCHRTMYKFPNGVKLSTKAWDHWKRIQLYVDLP